ncbi:Ethyl tert-butyl ether degradation EthD [Thalassoporum mexicanum PCC 7367]|uniref:EthD domain-containing protein n=1 Tax=Thalassoporum mexicanum TaxID=3457544 RepID=UPI00029FC51B|nr:EthD domain-containing protein [Pseudanabaena sp. PCC 7367]AFY68597.1 Ethyl tert-butyl ether degradation EthD [Pseudanabaena sp. PCC 7367]
MSSEAANTRVDFSARDQEGEVAFYVLLWKRKGITLEMFDDYWRDVHGPVCARLPGQYQYWQYHVAHNEGGIWPETDGINSVSTPEEQFDGIAELTFKSAEDRNIWFKAAAILMDDEHNIFSKAIGYNTNPGNSITYCDGIVNGQPNGKALASLTKLLVMIRKKDDVSVEDFRKFLSKDYAAEIAKSPYILKLRLHLFEEVDNTRPPAAGVAHGEDAELNYQAAIEICFEDKLNMENFFKYCPSYSNACQDQAKYIKDFYTFPNRSTYTFVYDGQMTLSGKRSSTVAGLISSIGAINQLEEDVMDLMIGKAGR